MSWVHLWDAFWNVKCRIVFSISRANTITLIASVDLKCSAAFLCEMCSLLLLLITADERSTRAIHLCVKFCFQFEKKLEIPNLVEVCNFIMSSSSAAVEPPAGGRSSLPRMEPRRYSAGSRRDSGSRAGSFTKVVLIRG